MIAATPLALIAAVAVAATAPAPKAAPLDPLPRGVTLARLVTPLTTPADPLVDGRFWHCEGATCRVPSASTAHVQSLARECESAARAIGAFESYQTGAAAVEGDDLARCNARAHKH